MEYKWETKPLGELVTFSSGGTPSKKNSNYWGGTIPWISAKTMKDERRCIRISFDEHWQLPQLIRECR